MNQGLLVTKRDGRKERIDLDKIHRVIDWAAEGLNNVSVSQVELCFPDPVLGRHTDVGYP